MITTLACAFALTSTPMPTPAPVVYRLKIANVHGLVASPLVRTLDGEAANVTFQDSKRHGFSISLVPHVSTLNAIRSDIGVSIDGAQALTSIGEGEAGVPTFLRLTWTGAGANRSLRMSVTKSAPDMRGDDIGVAITASSSDNQRDNLFRSRSGGAAPNARPVVLKFELQDSKHTIAKPTVRTLEGMSCMISARGPGTSYVVEALPRVTQDGSLMTAVRVSINQEDPVEFVTGKNTENPLRFMVTHSDHGLTTRVVEVSGRRAPAVKPGDFLIILSESVETKPQ